ncbi:OB-fold protein [Spongiimicrobium sp. 2-473A-2-J]|uniref:OB-fold protein n=1 Tax=Eudoraea algarum TaxID=3417568 RepID=UPI003D368126
MKGKRLKWGLALAIASISLIVVGLSYYNKPHTDVEKSEVAYKVTARNLIWEYQEDEMQTDQKYAEQVIQVQGQIIHTEWVKDHYVVTLDGGNLEAGIICHMQPDQGALVTDIEKGREISVKGICTGYLLDVMLVKCILIN